MKLLPYFFSHHSLHNSNNARESPPPEQAIARRGGARRGLYSNSPSCSNRLESCSSGQRYPQTSPEEASAEGLGVFFCAAKHLDTGSGEMIFLTSRASVGGDFRFDDSIKLFVFVGEMFFELF